MKGKIEITGADMTGCFDFKQKRDMEESNGGILPGPKLRKIAKMLKSKSDDTLQGSPKVKSNRRVSSDSSVKQKLTTGQPRRRFVRVIRGQDKSDDYDNPHVRRKYDCPNPDGRVLYKSQSLDQERPLPYVVPEHSILKKHHSLDVAGEQRKHCHAHFNEKVDIIQLDAFGRYSCLLHEKIQEECPINDFKKFEFKCPVSSEWLDDDVFTVDDRSESKIKSDDSEMTEVNEKTHSLDVSNKDKGVQRDLMDVEEDCASEESESSSCASEAASTGTTDEPFRPRTSSFDLHNLFSSPKLAKLKYLFRSKSDTVVNRKSRTSSPSISPKASPSSAHRRRFVRVIRGDDPSDDYENPHVIRKEEMKVSDDSPLIRAKKEETRAKHIPLLRSRRCASPEP